MKGLLISSVLQGSLGVVEFLMGDLVTGFVNTLMAGIGMYSTQPQGVSWLPSYTVICFINGSIQFLGLIERFAYGHGPIFAGAAPLIMNYVHLAAILHPVLNMASVYYGWTLLKELRDSYIAGATNVRCLLYGLHPATSKVNNVSPDRLRGDVSRVDRGNMEGSLFGNQATSFQAFSGEGFRLGDSSPGRVTTMPGQSVMRDTTLGSDQLSYPVPQRRLGDQPSASSVTTETKPRWEETVVAERNHKQQTLVEAAPESPPVTVNGSIRESTATNQPSHMVSGGPSGPRVTPSSLGDGSTSKIAQPSAGFKHIVCPTAEACSISLSVPAGIDSTLIAHPTDDTRRRVMSGFGQEVDFGLSGIEARRRAPPQVDTLMAEYAYSRIVVKVFTYAPYALGVGSYDLILFGNNSTFEEYVGQLVVMDLNYCVTEGDHDTLFDHLVAYSNDVAANGVQQPNDGTTEGDADSNAESPDSGIGPGDIAGIVCGVLLAAISGCLITWLIFKLCRGKQREEERDLVGAAAAADGDNCVDLESVDPLESLDVPAPTPPSVVLYPSPEPSTVCSSPLARSEYISDDPNIDVELRRAAGQVLADVRCPSFEER
ncbi:hypothetical protein Pmar_PMAR014562 [Perkinsus marinus ATCC 50983]|uniref:Uncharacterized protein n=1 Tax=Perkinsus marinus (strain ATCC 50983 / TXsc) TaxID=423536 RepID=C5LIE3_PERM5|nr:hypothetical protein Pmar_PMAR014562 [Perkinsus marinus ATCC 50983]EER03346.1 hypothetical protein Pmar_PMAR014562 [Perkinsus marinus ATCC 50983]|eukprot:XP_002771530.1 hypothetical protein Pmar_PMAR014562 [Perkinsus marinus ATCC 50983]